jgi:hypothetical protein
MKNKKAIVTLAVGGKYHANWKKFCEPNWKQYADRYGFDLVCLESPLDTSERAQARSVAWQKCLILGIDFAGNYDQVVWIDSDIMINACAPDLTTGVPLDKVGAAEDASYSEMVFLKRAFKLWPGAIINQTPQEYYSMYGLPADCDRVLNTGVMVLSPRFHRTILEHVYYAYEEKGGREWHMEMRPLSYELVKAGAVHWIDSRFNRMWPIEEIVHYPFLLQGPAPQGLRARIEQKIQTVANSSSSRRLRAACLNATFQSSYFLHLGGMQTNEMQMVNQHATSWWDILP